MSNKYGQDSFRCICTFHALHFLQKERLLCLPVASLEVDTLLKKGSTLKGKNLLLGEQILSFKS